MRQRNFTRSEIHFFALEVQSLRSCTATDDFDRERADEARPFFHAFVGLGRETLRGIVPLKTNPNGFGIDAVAVAEGLAVVIVESEGAVSARESPEGGCLGHALRSELANRIERNDRAGTDVKRQGCEIDVTLDPSFAFVLFARPPILPGAGRQIDAARLRAFFDDGRDEQ